MPKYGVVTYKSRKQSTKKNMNAQTEFDLALAAKNGKKKTENCRKRDLKMARDSELKVKRASKLLEANKKRKLNPLLEDDLFGFTESDSDSQGSQDSTSKKSSFKSRSPSKEDSNDSTTTRGSPFKTNSPFKNRGSPFKNNSPLKSNLKSPQKHVGVKKTVKFEGTDGEECGSPQDTAKKTDCTVDDEQPTHKQVCSTPTALSN